MDYVAVRFAYKFAYIWTKKRCVASLTQIFIDTIFFLAGVDLIFSIVVNVIANSLEKIKQTASSSRIHLYYKPFSIHMFYYGKV